MIVLFILSLKKSLQVLGPNNSVRWDTPEEDLGRMDNGIFVPITPKMKSPRKCLGYDFIVSSLPTLDLVAPMKFLFVVGGV
jgi:hypothetical protein